MWHLVFCETMPCVSPCYEWHTLLSVRPCPLWDLAFCETLASVRPCLLWDPGFCEALPSVRLFLLWETLTLFIYVLFYDALPSVRRCLCLVGETLSSVKPCLYVRFCLPWCMRPCHLLLFIWRCLMGETLPYLALCETLPSEAHSFEDVLTFKKQETTAVLILLWESHVMDLPTGFVRTWALDIANSCWIPSKRTDWEVWATVLANCQILKLSCFYVPCHVVIFSSLSSMIFPNFPCFLIFLKVVFSPHLGLTPQTFQ